MSDPLWVAIWLALLGGAIGGCVLLHHLGLATTHARDLLHIGTGVWVLGWQLWSGRVAPLLIVFGAFAITALVPLAARASRTVDRVRRTFSDHDELWTGLVLYTAAYAIFTFAGVHGHAFAAGAALLALSLGDGIGGAVGQRFGKHRFTVPGGKRKSFEGSATVALGAACAVLIAAWRFEAPITAPEVAGIGAAAAIAEAVSPRSTDNLIIPAVVFGIAETLS